MTKVLFVCLGNICRSPTAHGVFEKKIQDLGVANIVVDSAGTGDWHIGHGPDARAVATALSRGIDMTHLRSRQITPADFNEFDYILAMDKQNLSDLKAMAPESFRGHLGLFLDFAVETANNGEVPDPYYGGDDGFDDVFDLVEDAVQGLINHLRERS